MRFLDLTLVFCMLNTFCSSPTLESSDSTSLAIKKDVVAEATNIILQSTDGGQTWQDISQDLPKMQQPDDFFVNESDLYMRINQAMYRSKRNLKTPVWEKISIPNVNTSLAFNRAGVLAYNYGGKIYQQKRATKKWEPVYTNLKTRTTMRTIVETSNGTIFVGSDEGLFKSADEGQNWKKVLNGGWVMSIVESEGVLVGTGQKGIMRSTDNGEHWESVINEGGVGIAIEKINGGFAAIAYNTNTTSRRVHISVDDGKTWEAISDGLQPSKSISSIKQMGNYLIVGHPDGIFRSYDMGKTWIRVHAAVEEFKYAKTFKVEAPFSVQPVVDNRRVFKIYASGNTLYAVARHSGC